MVLLAVGIESEAAEVVDTPAFNLTVVPPFAPPVVLKSVTAVPPSALLLATVNPPPLGPLIMVAPV
jgi:hypothetical protein